jgi:diguanylate cyclase (GGDEF)-like protein
MSLVRPNDYIEVLREVSYTGVKDYESERRIFSYSHEDIGSETLRIWGIPEVIYQPIAHHHEETDINGKHSDLTKLIGIGDMVSNIYFNKSRQETMESLCVGMNDKYGVNADDVRSFVDAAAAVGSDILASFDIPSEQLRPYSQLLQEANAEMFRLNLTYDQLLRRYADKNEKAARLADELKEANRKLQELAITDGLTGLYNFRYFHTELQKAMARAQRHIHSVSLVLLDIDNFKLINDNYGHISGDIVLKSLAGLIWESSRNVDTVARYGGEEFSLILPETDLKGAAVIAEKLRKTIEANAVDMDSIKIRVTVSLGICVYDPKRNQLNEDEFIKAADRALYNSKRSGKNRLSIASL